MNAKYLIFFTFFSIFGLLTSAIAAPTVSITLEPETVPLNEASWLTVNIKNGERGAGPNLKTVDGLVFTPAGQSSHISIVNGSMTSVHSYKYRVTASKDGEFQIPAVTVDSGGQDITSNSITLKVTAAKKNIAQPHPQQGEPLSDEEKKQIAFMTINHADNKGREHLYVGESTPVMIKAYFRSGLRVSNINKPSLSSDAFTLSALSREPEQNMEVFEGSRYHVLSWYGNLSGIKAGDHDLTTQLKATVNIPKKRSPTRRRGSDPFSDPFFDDFFTQYESKEVVLTSEMKKTKVISPPQEGRPDSFTGAVGQYQIKANALPAAMATGEAVTLEVYVEGKGNFDRVDKPSLMPAKSWKTYKAKTELKRGDIVDFHARKHFSIPAVVTEPGELETFFQFSYFDPDTEKYNTIETAKHKIKVTGSAVSMTYPDTSKYTPVVEKGNLPIMKEHIGALPSSHSELYQRPLFRVIIGLLGFVILGSGVLSMFKGYKNKYPEASNRRKYSREIQRQFTLLETFIEKGEILTFFKQCRMVIQNQIALEKGGQADTITINDVIDKFSTSKTAIDVFQKADEVEFAAQDESEESMKGWLNKTQIALEEIKSPPVSKSMSELKQTQSPWGQVSSET